MTQTALKFFYNGIKANGGKLQRCFYSEGALRHSPEGTITIYARDYSRFSAEVRAAFVVENNSDGMTDYFETDSIRVEPTHPLYDLVAAALRAQTDRREKKAALRASPKGWSSVEGGAKTAAEWNAAAKVSA